MKKSERPKVLITMSAAARLLGYSSSPPIRKLISEGKLTSFSLPDSSRKLVDRNELESLIKPYNPKVSVNKSNNDQS